MIFVINEYSGVLFYPKHVGSYLRNAIKSGGLNPYSVSTITSNVSVNVISEMTGVSPDDIIMVSRLNKYQLYSF